MPKPDGPQFSAYEEELDNAVTRRFKNTAPLGRGTPGPLGPLDADLIDRSRATMKELNDFGYKIGNTDTKYPRGVEVDIGEPDVGVIVSPNPDGKGFSISVDHGDRFATTESGDYKYPEGWGSHRGFLDVEPHELPGALMDHLSRPEVRKHLKPPQ